MGIIVSAFPGCGKTSLFNEVKNKIKILDSDSSKFDKTNFPDNYIKHIKDSIESNDIILISSHKEVRDALIKNGIDFDLFYPNKERRIEFLSNYVKRNSPPSLIQKIDSNWYEWINEIENEESPYCSKHELCKEGDFIGNDEQIITYIKKVLDGKKS